MPLIALRLPLLVALLAGCMTLAACDRETRAPAQPPSGSPPAVADAAPEGAEGDFVGKIDRSHKGAALPKAVVSDPSGARLDIESLKGKPVLINLWATWCGPCVKELPTLNALAAQKAGGIAVVTVSQDMGQPDKVAGVITSHHYDHLHAWLDPQNTLAFFYNSGELPTSVLYDAQGREVWRMAGAHDWSGADSAALIAPALN